MATTTIKAYLDFTNNSAVVTLNAGNSANAGISLAAPNVIEDMWLIAQGTLNFTRVIKGSLSTTQIELQEPWNGSTTANVECRISTSGSSVANLTAAVRALISSSTSIGDHIDDAVGAHAASAIANTPAGGITETTVQGALNGLESRKAALSGAAFTGNVKAGPDSAGYGTSEPLAVVKDAAAAVNVVVRNNSSSASASAGIAVNAYGNSWRMAVGSSAKNGNRLTLEIDALVSPVEKLGLSTSGRLTVSQGLDVGGYPSSASWWDPGRIVGPSFSISQVAGADQTAFTTGAYQDTYTGAWYHRGAYTANQYVQSAAGHVWKSTISAGTTGATAALQEHMTLGSTGRLWLDAVGTAGGNSVLSLYQTGYGNTAEFYQCGSGSPSGASAALKLWSASSGASIRASGTINASGADYAEYRDNGGLEIAKGAIVGYRADGKLTLTWSEAVMARVKSTAPSIVGADTWASPDKIGIRPEEPQFKEPTYSGRDKPTDLPAEPQAPIFTLAEPEHPGDDASAVDAANYVLLKREYDAAADDHARALVAFESDHAAWVPLHEQYLRDMADWRTDQVEHETRVAIERNLFDTTIWPEYQRALPAFEARLEEARRGVDRIAYCGIVPCNVLGATPGHYIVAAEGPGDTIIGLSVRRPTEDQWSWVVGRCLRVLPDGRAEIDVMLS